MSIHKLIRDGRARLGMNEAEFGKLVGVSRGAVQQWEKENGTAPNRSRQQAVADALGITVAELMGEPADLPAWPFKHLTLQQIQSLDKDDLQLVENFALRLVNGAQTPAGRDNERVNNSLTVSDDGSMTWKLPLETKLARQRGTSNPAKGKPAQK